MSAFVVDKEHVDLMVQLALHGPSGRAVSPDTAWHRPSWYAGDPEEAYAEAGGGEDGWKAINAIRREIGLHDEPDAFPFQRGHVLGPSALGQMLVMECVASVGHRYPGDEIAELPGPRRCYWTEPYVFERQPYTPTAVEALSAIACYRYQSCEHPGWKDSEAFAFCDVLEQACIGALPGYRDAPWCWDSGKIAERHAARFARSAA